MTPIPKVELEIVAVHEDRASDDDAARFLEVRRFDLIAVQEDGSRSERFRYDVLERRALDACIVVAHYAEGGHVSVYLRSALRPPVALRQTEPRSDGLLWEVPAGLVEPGEGARAAAVRELEEELGFRVAEERLRELGAWSLPAPGFIGEVHHYFHVVVEPERRREPNGDGSVLEQGAVIRSVRLDDALAACRAGKIRDAKTELALRRLADHLATEGGY